MNCSERRRAGNKTKRRQRRYKDTRYKGVTCAVEAWPHFLFSGLI